MATYEWSYGAEGSGLYFTITYDTSTNEFTVTSIEGSFDLNALWWSDGNGTKDGDTSLSKADNSLNMNGSTTVFDDDGNATAEKIVWDGYEKLSRTGLGFEGTEKSTYISEGETTTFSGSAAFTDFLDSLADGQDFTLGVRATSVSGGDYGDSIKFADTDPAYTPDEIAGPDTSHDYDDLNPEPTTDVWNASTTTDDIKVGNDQANHILGGNGDDQLYGRGGNDTLEGNNHDDTIYGQAGDDILQGNGGNDTIYGGSGNDTITGGGGADVLWGGSGDDNFVYAATGDSSGLNIDTIYDFGNGADKIDVSAIDPNGAGSSFTWGGTTATADGVWYSVSGGNTTLHFDTDNDTTTDEMTIVLIGTPTLDPTDFVL
jgi:Ca2+-binding RTX toxin-like protein